MIFEFICGGDPFNFSFLVSKTATTNVLKNLRGYRIHLCHVRIPRYRCLKNDN